MKNIVNNLEKMIVHIKGHYLYAINKHHTLTMKIKLEKEYPEMCFQTNKWEKDLEFVKVRENYILFKSDSDNLIKISSLKMNLKAEFDDLKSNCKTPLFEFTSRYFNFVRKHRKMAPFFHLKLSGKEAELFIHDTSTDVTITRLINVNEIHKSVSCYLPVKDINTLSQMDFTSSEVLESDDENYYLFRDETMEAIVSNIKIENKKR